MTCEEVRVALSARLDGEDPGAPADALDAHTLTCAECRDWQASAERVTRTARSGPAAAPDLTAPILAAIAADARPARGSAAAVRGRRQVLRVAVAALALAQLVTALPVLFGVPLDAHTGREMASFDVAVAVGFALVAWRPERAQALLPVAFVLALCLAVTSAVDIATAHTAIVHEAGHLASVAQTAVLWALARTMRGTGGAVGATATAAGRW